MAVLVTIGCLLVLNCGELKCAHPAKNTGAIGGGRVGEDQVFHGSFLSGGWVAVAVAWLGGFWWVGVIMGNRLFTFNRFLILEISKWLPR